MQELAIKAIETKPSLKEQYDKLFEECLELDEEVFIKFLNDSKGLSKGQSDCIENLIAMWSIKHGKMLGSK